MPSLKRHVTMRQISYDVFASDSEEDVLETEQQQPVDLPQKQKSPEPKEGAKRVLKRALTVFEHVKHDLEPVAKREKKEEKKKEEVMVPRPSNEGAKQVAKAVEEEEKEEEEERWLIISAPKVIRGFRNHVPFEYHPWRLPDGTIKVPQEVIDAGIPCLGPPKKRAEFGPKEYRELVKLCLEAEPLFCGADWTLPEDDKDLKF